MFASPIVKRLLALGRLVTALGWAAARDLASGVWEGWEADFLVAGLTLVAEAERDATMLDTAALWRSSLSPRSAVDG